MKETITIFMLLFATGALHAQWIDDVSKNKQITPNNLAFYDPEMLTTSDGNTFLFFQVPLSELGKRSMRLQIIDKSGKSLFHSGGTTVSEERNITYTKVNQSMMTDNEGNAIVAVYDQRHTTDGTTFGYYIYKYSPNGKRLWGPVALNNGQETSGAVALSMCCTDGNDYIFAYGNGDGMKDQHIACEKLSKNGEQLWKAPITFYNEAGTFNFPTIKYCGNDQLMLLYIDQSATVFARMLNGNGQDLWSQPTTVYNGGFGSQKLWDVINVSNGLNGTVWFSCMDASYNSRAVCIDADGSIDTDNGTQGIKLNSDGYGADRAYIVCDSTDQTCYASFTQFNSDFSQYGVFAMKLGAYGTPIWTAPRTVVDFTPDCQIHNASIKLSKDNTLAFFYQKMEGRSDVGTVGNYIACIDKDGNAVRQPYNFSTSATTKNLLSVSSLINNNYFIAGWTEKRVNSNSDSYFMQKVEADAPTAAIQDVNAKMKNQPTVYYSLDGVKSPKPLKGLNIVLSTGADNATSFKKIMVK